MKEIVILCAVVVIGAVFVVQHLSRKEKKNAPEASFERTELRATVTDMACGVKMVSVRTPKTVKEFIVVFETDTGERLQLSVPEEMYEGFEKGQTGILTLSEGELYGFAPIED